MKRKLLLALLISTETMICITLGVVLAKTIREEDRSIIIIEQPIEYNINSNNSYDDSYNYEGDDMNEVIEEGEVDAIIEEDRVEDEVIDDIIIEEDKTINTEVESNVKKEDEVVKYIYEEEDEDKVEDEVEAVVKIAPEEDVVVKHIVKAKKQEEKKEEREIIHTYEECPFIGKTLTPQERLEASKRYACACVH